MKILVTGGAGLIGKYLVRSLLENDHFVTIFDNISNSTKDSISSLVDSTACEKNHVKKLIVTTSAAVYGESSTNVKLTEEPETNPTPIKSIDFIKGKM